MSRPPLSHRIADQVQGALNRLGDLWNRLVWPIESAVGRLGEALFAAFDGFADFEALVVRAVSFLLWPFVAVGRFLGRWLPTGRTDGSPSWLLAGPAWLGGALFRLAERLNLDGVLLLATRLLTPLWWPIFSVVGAINAWLATRRPRELALAVPALVMAAPFAYVAAQASWQSRSTIESRYQVAARDAIEAGDYARAELLERKLAQLGIDTRRSAYRTGLSLADEGDLAGAMVKMSSIAPIDAPGYPAAHAWIAQRLATAEDDGVVFPEIEDPLAVAQSHLDHLGDLGVDSAGIAQLRAYVFMKRGLTDEAIDALEPYASGLLEAAALRLRLLAAQRQGEPSRAQAKELLRLIERERRSGKLDPRWCEGWLLAAQIVEDPQQIEQAIGVWLEADPDAERPRQLLALLRRQQAEKLAADPTANPTRVVKLLVEAIRLGAPKAWADRTLARMSPTGVPSPREQRVWERVAVTIDAPADLLFTAATRAASLGAVETARIGYATLVERNEAGPEAWNNYAWTLLQEPEPKPQEALAAVEKALVERPADHRFRETRGQTLLALGRWEDAITDLEYALNGMPESPDVHASLARCYDRLAKPQLAEIHRRRAAQ